MLNQEGKSTAGALAGQQDRRKDAGGGKKRPCLIEKGSDRQGFRLFARTFLAPLLHLHGPFSCTGVAVCTANPCSTN